jgi:hypothetical protein
MSDLLEQVVMPQDEPTRLIPLTQGKHAIVDAADFEWLSQWKWHADWSERRQTWTARTNLRRANGKYRGIRMHQMLMGYLGFRVDHRNGDGLDNRRSNLRPCTAVTNAQNRSKLTSKSSIFKGVTYNRQGMWQAYIRVDKKLKHLGMFDNEIDAARAYNLAANEHFGAFAKLNDLNDTKLAERQNRLQDGRRSATGFRGVSYDRERNKFEAQIHRLGKTHHLGRFENAHDAALAYDKAATDLLGPKAVLNFPPKG